MEKFDYKAWLQARYERLPPQYKKYLGILLVGIAAFAVLYIGVSQTSPKHPPRQAKPMVRNIIGQKEMAQRFTVGQVNSQLEQMLKENKDLRDKLERLHKKEAAAPAFDPAKMQLEVAKQVQQELAKQGAHEKEKKDVETFLPAGSIFPGTLITGLDVSCGKSSKKDPFPVLLRVKKEAILPNFYRADVRECFLIAAGWGDLGSERAYLRGERLSCIRADGKAIETKIDMYAVGEDGKAGVRGRLVSKTGALLSKALLAGFMEGFSKVFTKTPVTVIATGSPGQTTPFQSSLSKDSMQSAGLEGAGSALERLSKYYIDLAKDIFPVIEIDAGRAVDFVLISGKSLKLQSRKSSDQ